MKENVVMSGTRNHAGISEGIAPTLIEMDNVKDIPIVTVQCTGFGWWKESDIAATLRTPVGGGCNEG